MHASWRQALAAPLASDTMQQLREFLLQRNRAGATIFPPPEEMFTAFNETPLEDVRVVILGQDPYCGPGQAHGLSFSVRPGVATPPSLQNIFKEMQADLGVSAPDHGCLLPWAHSGVLLLNAVLSVELRKPGAHAGKGWEELTSVALEALNERPHLVFMLWGAAAKARGEGLDRSRHLVLQAAHPSPRSADRGFFGCRHFSACNDWLGEHDLAPVDWSLPARADLPPL